MRYWPLVLSCACACGGSDNDLPDTGDCIVEGADSIEPPAAEPVDLVGHPAPFDDLRYSSALDRVMAAPGGVGSVFLVDPSTQEVTRLDGLPTGIASVDEGQGWLFTADRTDRRILSIDPDDGAVVSTLDLDARPDYVRHRPDADELWVTEPGADGIEILAADADGRLEPASFVAVPGGPEGLVFDPSRGRAYTHLFSGELAVIDVDARETIDTWPTGCAGSHGIPVVDEARGLVFAGCSGSGGGAVLDVRDGTVRAGYEVGSGEAVLAYAPQLGHFYLRGDPGDEVALLAVCDDGRMSLLGRVTTAHEGHGMASDPHGAVWVCNAGSGGLQRVSDPYPGVPLP